MKYVAYLLLFSIISLNAQAEERGVEAMVRSYNDGQTQVISPHTDVHTTVFNDAVLIGAGYAMDIVTSSSCDVKSWASAGVIKDTRKEIKADVALTVPSGTIGTSFVQSDENDYHSIAVGIGTSKDFFDKNTTISMSFNFGDDHIKSSKDAGFDQVMQNETFSLGISQVFSKVSVGQFLYDYRVEGGYLSSPYRVARIQNSDGTVLGLQENAPRTRNRHSFAFKYNYFLKSVDLSTASTFRFYTDSWGVYSGTIEERLSKELGRFSLSFNARFYYQTAANFYRDIYTNSNLGSFYTGNKTLSTYWTALAGLRPTFKIKDRWEIYAKAEYYIINHNNFTDVGDPMSTSDDKLYKLNATIFGLGASGKF